MPNMCKFWANAIPCMILLNDVEPCPPCVQVPDEMLHATSTGAENIGSIDNTNAERADPHRDDDVWSHQTNIDAQVGMSKLSFSLRKKQR